MPIYTYKVITPDRNIIEGKMTSFAAFWVRLKLKYQKNTVLSVQRYVDDPKKKKRSIAILSISSIQRILLFRNMGMMLDSGIPLSDVLRNMITQVKGAGVRSALQNIFFEVSNGSPLSRALSKYPKLFPQHIVKTIEVGEQSGTLSQTLDRISVDLEKSYQLRRKVIGAVSYPLIIMFFMIVTAILLIVMVLPQIIKLFADLDTPLPFATRVLQVIGEFLATYPLHILIGIIITLVTFSFLMKIRRFRLVVHASILRIPIFGTLTREYSLSVFTRALGTLLSSGITFVQALETVKGTVRNESYIQCIERMYPIVLQGGSFSDAMQISTFHFPDQFRYLIEVGEKTGKLRIAFDKSSSHYERSVMFQTQMLTTVLEPILMLLAGLLVGFLAFSIFGPLYNVATIM